MLTIVVALVFIELTAIYLGILCVVEHYLREIVVSRVREPGAGIIVLNSQ